MTNHDALLYVSFGGPEAPDEVMPFLEHVVAGRDVPRARLEEVAEHYFEHDGRSPINDQNREMIAALRPVLDAAGVDLPLYFGNRNSAPWLRDALREIAADGHRRVLAYVTSAYSSWSGCRQYREDLHRAAEEAGVDLEIDKVRVFHNHPGFVGAQADRLRSALDDLDATAAASPRLLYVSHSIPRSMARHSDYEAQHLDTCRLVTQAVDPSLAWDLVWCSRSGPPTVPWLEPDVGDRIAALATGDTPPSAIVVVPVGFVSDHMEVIHDLDVEAREVADDHGLPFVRVGTVGTHPTFVAGVRDLILERVRDEPRAALGIRGPSHDACPVDCCHVPGRPQPPTVAEAAARTRPTGH